VSRTIEQETLRAARWFAGKHRAIEAVEEVDATRVPGGRWRLALVDVRYRDGAHERYLLPDAGGREPAPGDGFWPALLHALRAGPLAGVHGELVLRPAPALDDLLSGEASEAVPSTDQSNTLVVVGDRLLVKAYRRLQAGVHPEVELGAALAGRGAPVPAHAGSIHHVAPDGADTAVALLQEFVPGAVSGWEPPIERAAALLRAGTDPAVDADAHHRLGATTAALHAALQDALGTRRADAAAGATWLKRAEAALQEVAGDAALAGGDQVDPIRARLAPLRGGAPALARVHGDLHVAQFLHAADRMVVVDLEGDPTLPLAERRAPDTPLRDVAGLLRSLDHVGSAAARRAAADPSAWIAAATDAALAGYAAVAPEPPDRRLLDALELAKELQELVYARRVLPEWAYTARAGLQRLLTRPLPQEL
jgi:maltokinase